MATNGDLARRLLGAAREDELAAISVLRVEGISDAIDMRLWRGAKRLGLVITPNEVKA